MYYNRDNYINNNKHFQVMKAIHISVERMNTLLPTNIKETDVLSSNAKRVLATILNYYTLNDKVKNSGFLAISNKTLRDSVGIKTESMFEAIIELMDANLIERKAGQSRVEGRPALATEYKVNWNNLMKPLKKKDCFEDFFGQYLNTPETPMGTANTNTITNTNSYTNTKTNADAVANAYTITNSIVNIENNNKIIEDNNISILDYNYNMNTLTVKGYLDSTPFPLPDSLRREVFDIVCPTESIDMAEYMETVSRFEKMTRHSNNQSNAIQYWKQNFRFIWQFVQDIEKDKDSQYKSLIQPLMNILELAIRKSLKSNKQTDKH